MSRQTIPRQPWQQFLQSFSRRHQGWLARMEIEARPGQREVEAHERALASITVEPKRPEGTRIAIMLNGAGGLTHWVERPAAIELRESEEGGPQVLAIESNDGSKLVLRFGAAPLPERPEGMARSAPRGRPSAPIGSTVFPRRASDQQGA